MKAIVPVAGSGTRLRPLTYSQPKTLVPVGGKPIIVHITESLMSIGCDCLILIVGDDGDIIRDGVRKHFPGLRVETVVQETPLGLGHAVSLAEEMAGGGELVVMYGDTVIDGDLAGLADRDADAVITVKEVEDPRAFGVVNIRDGLIEKFVEKPEVPESNLAIVGLNWFRDGADLFRSLREIIDSGVKTRGEFQITDAFELMVGRGRRFKPFRVDGWYDCGNPETLLDTNRFLLARSRGEMTVEGSVILPPVSIPDDAVITRSVIGPYVSIGNGSVIENSIISDSIIGSESHISNASLVRSVIGDFAEVNDRPKKLIIGSNSLLHNYTTP